MLIRYDGSLSFDHHLHPIYCSYTSVWTALIIPQMNMWLGISLFVEPKFSNSWCKQHSEQYHQTSELMGRKRREKRHFNIPPSIFVSSSADGNASSIPDDADWEPTKAWACFSAILLAVARSMALRLKILLPVVLIDWSVDRSLLFTRVRSTDWLSRYCINYLNTFSSSLFKSPDAKTICLHSVSINLLVAHRYIGYVTGDKVRDRQDMIYTLLCLCLLILELGFCSWSEQMDANEKERLDDRRRRTGILLRCC